MPTASQLGLIKGGEFLKLEIDRQYELVSLPEFGTTNKFHDRDGKDAQTFKISTTEGILSGMSKTIIGQFRSKKEKSLGQILNKVLSLDETLTVWARVSKQEGKQDGISLSLF